MSVRALGSGEKVVGAERAWHGMACSGESDLREGSATSMGDDASETALCPPSHTRM